MNMASRFSLLTFPQRFDGARLHVRILVVPRLSPAWDGDPRPPMIENFPAAGDSAAAFADADLNLKAVVIDDLNRFPVNDPVDFTAPLPDASGPAPDARALYEELVAPGPGRFVLDPGPARLAEPVKPQIYIQKYLPVSYRESFLFSHPRTDDAKTDDSYACAIRDAQEPNPLFKPTPDTVSWGQIYAYCLRHHQLARRLGLIREAAFNLPVGRFDEGGFLYVDLDGGDYAQQAGADFTFLARYAARIPKLEAGVPRVLFGAVLFPVLFDDPAVPGTAVAPGNYDTVFLEAADYDDGFAKIVHGTQPVSQNLLAEEPDGFTPVTEMGVRLGWDDEQVLIWQNRQLKADPTVPPVAAQPQRLDAPLGAFGYRIDARPLGTAAWHTLVRVRSEAPLQLGAVPLGDPPAALWEGELAVEVHPQQLDGDQENGQFWLPSYMCQWNGASMVLPDEVAAALFKTEVADTKKASLARLYDPVGLDQIPLRYGKSYDFRVRLSDPTGGGPELTDEPVHESPAPEATVALRRHIVPEPLRIAGLPKFPDAQIADPGQDGFFQGDKLDLERPLLGYPAVVFTGKYPDPIPLLQAASDQAVGKDSFGIPDPDVVAVQVEVEVASLRMDNKLSLSGREAWAHLYTTRRNFPAAFDQGLEVALSFRDAPVLKFGNPADLGDLGVTQAELDALTELVLPTARDIRLTLRAVANPDPAYFAPDAHIGKPLQLLLRRESADETDLFADTSPGKMIRGIYLQPDPIPLVKGFLEGFFKNTTGDTPSITQRLAQQVGVENKGLTLVGKRGERVVFGCSRRIRHTLSPDGSSITFAAKEDLINHWIVPITLQLDRDWTWDGVAPVSFEIFRSKTFQADAEVDGNGGQPVGDWEMVRTAPLQALDEPERDYTRLIFFDAVEPKSALAQAANPAQTRFPDIVNLDYQVQTRFRKAPAASDPDEAVHIDLPVTTTPAQVPRLASAGLALSKYQRNEEYSATEPRRRFLWLEFEEPARDPHDTYFIRVLGYAPDPLLSDNRIETWTPPEESPLAIDPELIRVISPDQADDNAGLGAMVPLIPAGNSDRHFMVSLPPGLVADSSELFGFFTYELRVGHIGIWSTAQGRFGRPLRATGVQHPAPTLFCTCHRDENQLSVEAPYAKAVLNGKNVTASPPNTQVWALLYAQVRQADGKDHRNILLDDRRLRLIPPPKRSISAKIISPTAFQNADAGARGLVLWDSDEIRQMLAELGLPPDAPLSVLCVEMMPILSALLDDLPFGQATGVGRVEAAAMAGPSRGRLPGAVAQDEEVSPLSDGLGHYRILRTSPLTEVPPVC
ncbi:MAG: hypothetical protein ACT4OM_10015 [Actinomycetota bacterium]